MAIFKWLFEIINFFKKYYPEYRFKIALFIIFSIFHKFLLLIIPLLSKKIVDIIVYNKNLKIFLNYSLWFLIATSIFIIVLSLKIYFKNNVELSIENEIKKDLLKKINNIEFQQINKKKVGYFIQRISHDTEKIRDLIISEHVNFFINLLYAAGILIIMFNLNIYLTSVLILFVPLFVLLSKYFIPRIKKVNKEILETEEDVKSFTEEIINGNYHIRVNNIFEYIEQKFNNILKKLFKLKIKELKYEIYYDYATFTGIMNISQLIIYLLGGFFVFKSFITVGTLIAFDLYFSKLWSPVEYFMEFPKKLKVKMISLDRIKELLEIKEINKKGIYLNETIDSIEFKNITFSYEKRKILSDINLKIKNGDRIGIIGSNGSGKSTILNLLVKILLPDKGTILINGKDYRDIKVNDIREKIILIPQEVYLFKTTLKENIFFNEIDYNGLNQKFNNNNQLNIDNQFIDNLMESIGLKNIILKKENGFETLISNKGTNFSGGEKKLIQLTRGIIKNGEVYLLDEPLAFVDKKYVEIIIEFIEKYLINKTLIIVSHNDKILKICNKIYKLENGVLFKV